MAWTCINQVAELQATYSNYKNTLQQLAQKIGDVEQEAEEHKSVISPTRHFTLCIARVAWVVHLSPFGFGHSKDSGL
jgi:hypothetical protein